MPTASRTPFFPLDGIVRAVLSVRGLDGWELHEKAFWTHVRGPEPTTREQGWKLHVSATPLSAPAVLHRCASLLLDARCEFKFAGCMERVEQLTSTRFDRAQAGKFLTAYPADDEQLHELAEALDAATAGLPGPRILSDRPWRPGSLVHLRYGAITGVPMLTNDGSFEIRLRHPDGSLVPDARKAWFSPPAWTSVPEPHDAAPRKAMTVPQSVLLNDRYRVAEAIRHSARGGVYRALDEWTGASVVIKQARSHIGSGRTGVDSRDTLRGEAVLLAELAPLTPALLEVFEAGDSVFLVEEFITGPTLASWIGERFLTVGVQPGVAQADAVDIARRLVELLAEVHRRGLVLRDLTPTNVIVAEGGELRLIDPELATTPGTPVDRYFTPTFSAPEIVDGPAHGPAAGTSADLYSLGAVLHHIATGCPPTVAPDSEPGRAVRDRLAMTLRLAGGEMATARALTPAIRGLMHPEPERRWTLDRLAGHLTTPFPDGVMPVTSDPVIDRVLDDGLDHIVATLDASGERLWPIDDFGAATDACNVQYGAAGVLAVLTAALDTRDRPGLRDAVATVARWIDARRDTVPRMLPGLYFGRAGTAWALHDAGRRLGDDTIVGHALELARRLPETWPNPDVCHGTAGAGLAYLHLWRETGLDEFRERAENATDQLLGAARMVDGDVLWPIPDDFESALSGLRHLGFAHGVAGVGTFLLAAARATGRADAETAARAAGDTLLATAEHGPGGGARWRADHRGANAGAEMYYHWCSGSSGIGTFLLPLAEHTGHAPYRAAAQQAADTVVDARWISGTSVCHGLAGNGEFLLDAGRPADAHTLATNLVARHALIDGRALVPDELGTTVRVGYGTGLAGVVGFLLRLRHGGRRWFMP